MLWCHTVPNTAADLDGDESEEEEMDLLDAENDSDADLDALLEDSNRLIGRSASQGRKRARTGLARQLAKDIQGEDEDEDEEEEDDAGYMYADLWGGKGLKKTTSDRLQGQHSALCCYPRLVHCGCCAAVTSPNARAEGTVICHCLGLLHACRTS